MSVSSRVLVLSLLSGVVLVFVGLVTAGQPAEAAFPGSNGKIAFTRISSGYGEGDVYLMNPDGSGVERITTSAGSEAQPVVSPDGTRIAFVKTLPGNNEIYVMKPLPRARTTGPYA